MTFLPANDEITLALGGSTVRLRPSLRAASRLERLHDGFAALHRRVLDFHLSTVRTIILTAATDRQEATAFLARLDTTPLKIVADAVAAPILMLLAGFVPASDERAKPAKNAKPMPWPAVYRELYRTATGWLGWTPEAAWNATPTEINEAFAGHIARSKAIHGAPEKDAPADHDPDEEVPLEQVREGLAKLKANARRGRK